MEPDDRDFSPKDREREKGASRAADAAAIRSGEKCRNDLQAENGAFAFPRVRVRPRDARSLR